MTATMCCCCGRPTPCTGSTPRWPAPRFARSITGPRDLAFPLEELLAAIRPSTRAILIANPNNPTGTGVGWKGSREFWLAAPHAAVLIDEAYFEFNGVTALPLIGRWPNLFVSRTFSKVYRHGGDAAGLRLLAGGQRRLPAQGTVALQREYAGRAGRHRGRPGPGLHRELCGRGAGGARLALRGPRRS